MSVGKWQFWIDRGGTFTDVVALRPDGGVETAKLLSENPEQYADAAAEGIRRFLPEPHPESDTDAVAAVKMGTTVATNALLERQGTPTVLVVSRGFGDALAIGYQNRPDIFALDIRKPLPIYDRVVEADERLTADGSVITPLDEADIRRALQICYDDGLRSVAICLVHGYRYTAHESRIAAIALELGFEQVSISHDVEALIKFVSRGETTLADAYLTPVLEAYIRGLQGELHKVATPERLLFMQSNGGLTLAENFRGKNSVLSGPAAGVVGMVETATKAGFDRLIGFDMGGTSTDVSAWSGEYERTNDSEVAGVRLRAPMMKIHTIAAGGGSVLQYKDQRYQVGPESAGANPGPACYRRGGPLAVTDANVLLGRIPVDYFPHVFGADGDQPLDVDVVVARFTALAKSISADGVSAVTPEEVAEGFLAVAVENMANAIRKITIERGEDVRDFVLCSFGGAAGQLACRVADVLDMKRVWLHPMAGVLSAYGMGLSDIRVERQQSLDEPFEDEVLARLPRQIDSLRAECDDSLAEQHVPQSNRRFVVTLGLRVRGSDTIIEVSYGQAESMLADFCRRIPATFRRGAGLGSADRIDHQGGRHWRGTAIRGTGSGPGFARLAGWCDANVGRRTQAVRGGFPARRFECRCGSSWTRDRRRGQRNHGYRNGLDEYRERPRPPGARPQRRQGPGPGRDTGRRCTRSREAGDIQSSVHAYCGTDGHGAPAYCAVGQYPRTTGLLLCIVRCARQTGFPMHRTCPCISAPWARACAA